jgi:hypothetical protein
LRKLSRWRVRLSWRKQRNDGWPHECP